MNDKETNRSRISLDVDKYFKDSIELLQSKIKVSTVTETIRKSIVLYQIITDHIQNGGVIIFRDKNGHDIQIKLL